MADFKKPWANWTPEIADAVRTKLEARAFNSQKEKQAALRALEGYWAEHDMERTLEQNAPTFSAYGLKRNVRALFPKTMESIEAKRPWWMTAFQVPRDIITSPQRAGIQVAGDITNAGIATSNALFGTGFQMIDPSTYTMAGTDRLRSDPGIALMASPQGRPMQLIRALSEKGAETAGRFVARAPWWVQKGARAVGSVGGEVAPMAGIEYSSNLGEMPMEEAWGAAAIGTGIGRAAGGAINLAGRGLQKGAGYLTRKKYATNRTDQEKSGYRDRKFGGEELPEEEVLFLESGQVGKADGTEKGRHLYERLAGEESPWAQKTGDAYERVAAQQNERITEALALQPEVGSVKTGPYRIEPKPGEVPAVRPENPVAKPGEPPAVPEPVNLSRRTGTAPQTAEQFRDSSIEFQQALRDAGIDPGRIVVRDNETLQFALARELNAQDAYAKKASAVLKENRARLGEMDAEIKSLENKARESRLALEERVGEFESMPRGTEKEIAAYEREASRLDKIAADTEALETTADQLKVSRSSLAQEIEQQERELYKIESGLNRAAELSDEMALGIVGTEKYAGKLGAELDKEAEFAQVPGWQVDAAKEAGDRLVASMEDSGRRLWWNKQESGRFIPAPMFRKMVTKHTAAAFEHARKDPVLETAANNAARKFRAVKNTIDQEQSLGELGETANSESLRYGVHRALLKKEPTVTGANRLTIGNLHGIIQQSPYYDRALQLAYDLGGKLTPRNAGQLTARRAMLMDQAPGGEWATPARNILATVGREAPLIEQDYGEASPAQKAWDNIENFIASIEVAKQGEAK